MEQGQNGGQVYLCPMHTDIRQPNPGKCPTCGMALVREGARFGMLRHLFGGPKHLVVMAAVMVVVMIVAMMMTRGR